MGHVTDRVCDGVCDGVCGGMCDGQRLSQRLSQAEGVMEVWLFGKDSFEECPLTVTSCPVPSMVSSSDDTKMCKTSVPVSVRTPDPVPISDPTPLTFSNSSTTLNISLLSAAAFQKVMDSKGAQCFLAFIWNPNKAAGCHVTPASESDLEGVPNIYHHFSDFFSKGSTNSLPPYLEYNLKFDIYETAKAPLGPVYPLSQTELGALCEFIDEHLNMGFIHPSNSPFGVPVLFVEKKDGSLWLCVDF